MRNWLVWSNEHNAWWRPEDAGYTVNVYHAGRYTLDEAIQRCQNRSHPSGELPPELPIHIDAAIRLFG